MKEKMNWFVMRFGKQLCRVAVLAAFFSTYMCKGHYYQPKEPEGLLEFSKQRTTKN